jgi:hypothetical protein
MDQEPQWLFSVRKFPNQLSGLLRNPDLIGVGGNTSKVDAARPQFNEEKLVVSHEMTPTNGSIPNRHWLNTISIKHIADCCQGDLEAQLEEFTCNLAIPPSGSSLERAGFYSQIMDLI